MAKLIYAAITSLDGYVADADGSFSWAAPDEEVHSFVNDMERGVGTYLYGRRMYEVMVAWEHPETFADDEPITQDYARTFMAQKDMAIDVWLSSHAGQFRMHDKYKPGDAYNPDRFVDPAGYLAAVQRLEKAYLDQVAEERRPK